MKRKKFLIALLVAFASNIFNPNMPEHGSGSSITARVVDISDGDTIKVSYYGRVRKVRLYGLDCPEKKQSFGPEARELTRRLALNRLVTVIPHSKDRYKRIVATVRLEDGTSLNRRLISDGLAWWYKKFAPNEFGYAFDEMLARLKGKGLWVERDPVPPWQFRRTEASRPRPMY